MADQVVRIWDVSELREVTRLLGHVHEVTGVAYSPDGRLLATSSLDHTVQALARHSSGGVRCVLQCMAPCHSVRGRLKLASFDRTRGVKRFRFWN